MSDENTKDDQVKPLGDGAGVYIPSSDAEEEPTIDFGSFIISLGTSAYVSLGRVQHPDLAAEQVKDLPAAQQVIDILKLLEVKTKGNLEPEEERLLGGLIYELQMAFVEAS